MAGGANTTDVIALGDFCLVFVDRRREGGRRWMESGAGSFRAFICLSASKSVTAII